MRWFVLLLCTLPAVSSAKPVKKRLNMPPGWTWPPSDEMKAEGQKCLAHLDALGVHYTKAPKARKVTTPIYVTDMTLGGIALEPIWKKGPFVMDCLLASAIADSADTLASAGVTALRFTEIYDYRNINEGKRAILSRHALGLAIDVFAFVTEDDVIHPVAKEYPNAFLLTLEDWLRDTEDFRLLTPGNDKKHHHDHFHFEIRAPGERSRSRVALISRWEG